MSNRSWRGESEGSRTLVDPALQGPEGGIGVPQCRGSVLPPVVAGGPIGDGLFRSCLEVSTVGAFHVGWYRGRGAVRRCFGRRHLSGQLHQSHVAEKSSCLAHDILPRPLPPPRYGTHVSILFFKPRHKSFRLKSCFVHGFHFYLSPFHS